MASWGPKCLDGPSKLVQGVLLLAAYLQLTCNLPAAYLQLTRIWSKSVTLFFTFLLDFSGTDFRLNFWYVFASILSAKMLQNWYQNRAENYSFFAKLCEWIFRASNGLSGLFLKQPLLLRMCIFTIKYNVLLSFFVCHRIDSRTTEHQVFIFQIAKKEAEQHQKVVAKAAKK